MRLDYLMSLLIIRCEALDIETIWDDGIAKPLCIAITSNEKMHFKIIDVIDIEKSTILDFLLEKCSSKKIYYVHNLTFEMFVFLRYMSRSNIKFKMISSNRTIYSAEIWYENKKIRFRCSYRLTMLSLKNLAKLSEVEKKDIFPYKILDRNLKKQMFIDSTMFNNMGEYYEFTMKYGENVNIYKILENYCKNDADITKKSIIKYWNIIEENGLKNNGKILTAAKLSIENYFQNNFIIKKKIPIKYDRIIRTGYFGGRTEVFGNPNSHEIVLHYDWSGMYAQCMREKVLGGEIFESEIIISIENPGFYWIKFEQNLEFPILPIRREKLLFANGIFEGWYWFEEIILAREYGVKILKVGKMISAQYYDKFIENFVNINDRIRNLGPLHKQIGKNNNNTFYGRLGMNPERLDENILSDLDKKNNYVKIVKINEIYIGYTQSEKCISNVLISASITSKARIKLYKGMMKVIEKGGRLLYTDTDSIIAAFDKRQYKKIMNIDIGEVFFDSKKKDTIMEDAVFTMPKTYALKYLNGEEIVKIKGFTVLPKFSEFKDTFYNKGDIITTNTEWNKKDLNVRFIEKEKKTCLYGLNKRRWDEDLKNTTPLSL